MIADDRLRSQHLVVCEDLVVEPVADSTADPLLIWGFYVGWGLENPKFGNVGSVNLPSGKLTKNYWKWP